MKKIDAEPVIAVGLVTGKSKSARVTLNGKFRVSGAAVFDSGSYTVEIDEQSIWLRGETTAGEWRDNVILEPAESHSTFTVHDILFGIDFHWERREDQTFKGALKFAISENNELLVINLVALEEYLTSVISSEMSATANVDLLRAHSIISRSWLLAQIRPWYIERQADLSAFFVYVNSAGERELTRWYARESHTGFDVCADDHCQRYQGVSKATETGVFETIKSTRGKVLVDGDAICDARFSKCCGGMVEAYDAVWDPTRFKYLVPLYDGIDFPSDFKLPLTKEENARAWISGRPPAFCNTDDSVVLSKILPGFDQETRDFFRWKVEISQEELQELLKKKLEMDFGAIKALEPVERAESGRLIRLRIVGEKDRLIIGKELEIRRALSKSHLYSSAFFVETEGGEIPEKFILHGAGWGHGVGLCQIGAALMAEMGSEHKEILSHYYPGAELHQLYD